MKFDDLGLSEPILRAVHAEGYTIPTPIQVQSIPHVLAGRDLLGCAQTGTGKTAAFALPILHRLSAAEPTVPATHGGHSDHSGHASQRGHTPQHGHAAHTGHATHSGHASQRGHTPQRGHAVRGDHAAQGEQAARGTPRRHRPIRALILSPTRELAAQIGDSFRAYGKHTGLRGVVIFGGINQTRQTHALHGGTDILVATPGRLLDLMNQGYIDLRFVEVLVLDEADRMLDMGFIHDIRKIVAQVPRARQTLFFSATMPADIRKLADSILNKPVSVQVAPESAAADNVAQSVYHVKKRNKPMLLAHLLRSAEFKRSIVFTRTKHGANRVERDLAAAGIASEVIHGNKSQGARVRAIQNFKTSKTVVLIATDIAARGLDIDGISHVVNFDLPNVPETYVHRIGRTARAGASGVAVSFCDPGERSYLRAIENLIQKNIASVREQPEYPTEAEPPGRAERPHQAPRREGRSDSRGSRPTQAPSRGHATPRRPSRHAPPPRHGAPSRDTAQVRGSAPPGDAAHPRKPAETGGHSHPRRPAARQDAVPVAKPVPPKGTSTPKEGHPPSLRRGRRRRGKPGVRRDQTGHRGPAKQVPQAGQTHHGRKE